MQDLTWLIAGMKVGTLIFIADGSCDVKKEQLVSAGQGGSYQQLNVLCNQLAKGAISRGIHNRFQCRGRCREGLQVLHNKDTNLFVRGEELMSDITKMVWCIEGRQEAKTFLINEDKWTEEQFEEVDWD